MALIVRKFGGGSVADAQKMQNIYSKSRPVAAELPERNMRRSLRLFLKACK